VKRNTYKWLCIAGIALLITAVASHSAAANTPLVRVYDGPKIVFEDKGAEIRGKPAVPPGKPPADQPNPSVDKWAVVIGISDYQGVAHDLRYCDDDARDMYNYLLAKGYPKGNIKLLLDKKATAKAIISAIDWLNSWEGPNSEVVFFYSGHGSYYDGYNDSDSEQRDEAIVSTDLYLILDGQLRQKFSTFSSQKISFTFDSCFSGGMDDLQASGRVIVAACGENQYSWDGTSDQQNGVFTYYYVGTPSAGLQTYGTVEGAFEYAAPLARDFVLHQYNAYMNPQMYDQYAGDWAF
jgi:hypothetical protein